MKKGTTSQEQRYLATLRILQQAAEAGDASAAGILARLNKLDEEQISLKETGIALHMQSRSNREEHAEFYRQMKSIINRLMSIKAERNEIIHSLRSNNLAAVYLYTIRKQSKRKRTIKP